MFSKILKTPVCMNDPIEDDIIDVEDISVMEHFL